MKRLASAAGVLLVVLLALVALGAGSASAQEPTPNPVAPITGITDEGNAFQQDRRECLDDAAEDAIRVGDLINSATGNVLPEFGCFVQSFEDNPGAAVSTAVSSAASAFWGDPVGDFTKAVMEGNSQAFRSVMTFWMTAGIPGLAADTAISGLRNLTTGFTLVALTASIVVAMAKLALARKQAVMEGATETAAMLVRTVAAVSLLPVLVLMAHQAGDFISMYALNNFVGGDLNERITAITAFDEKTGLGPILALACAGFAFLGSVAQLIALLIREAVLCIVVAVIPIAAASSATGTGRSSYKTMIGFTIGALLFKPAATLIYLVAFWWSSADWGDAASTAILGSMMLAVVGFSLPALIAVVAPAASTISAGGRETGALAAAGGALAATAARPASQVMKSAAGAVAPSGAAGGAGGSSGAAGTGARPTPGMQGRYSGSGGGGGSQQGASGPLGAARRVGGAAVSGARTASATGMRGAAGAVRVAGSGMQGAASVAGGLGAAADGAIGNYHGRIQR